MLRMRILGLMFAAGVLASLMATPVAAQPADKRTVFTFNQPVALPGVTLPAGQYMFRFVDQGHKVFQVLSADGTQVYGMVLTRPSERVEPASTPEVSFMETAEGMPAALKAWWYPGERTGSEVIYPQDQAYLLAHGASRRVPTVARGETDQEIAEEVAGKIRRYAFYTIYDDVYIEAEDGVVTLTGRVTMPHKANDMAKLAGQVSGVRDVRNRIQTLPVSAFDDELRIAIASQIYRDPLFWNYAIQVNPPIHVIVEHGRVALTGAVHSEVEKQKAEVIARGTFGVLGVDNQLRVDTQEKSEPAA
jgi:hyperosmotically inducible protein